MTERNVVAKRRPATPEKRDLIFIILGAALLLIFLSRAMQFSLVGNLYSLVTAMGGIGIVAAGQTLVVITGGIDLSVGSLAGLTSVIMALLATTGIGPLGPINPWLAAGLALVIATVIGWIHGTLISQFKLAPFVVTFGSLSLLLGLAKVLSNGSPINLHSDAFQWIWTEKVFGLIPVSAVITLIVFMISAYLLRNSRFGRHAYAIGSNETVARLSGINVDRTRQIVYAYNGFLAGMAGLLMLAFIDGGSFSLGQGYELLSIAAVIIGGTSLKGGTGSVWGTLGGVLLLSMVSTGLILFSAPANWNDVISGAIIVGAALIDVQRRRLQQSAPVPVPIPLPTPVSAANTLDQAVSRFMRTIQERYGCQAVRVYLLDRDSGTLIEPISQEQPEGPLATQVQTSGRPVYINDLRRDRRHQGGSLDPEIRAVAAVPILYRERMIGVFELQSAVADAFADAALESMVTIGAEMAESLEDNWLLEGGWLTRQVRDGLRNLSDDIYLDKSALGEWLLPTNDILNRAEALRQALLDGIEHFRPMHSDSQSRAARRYQILKQTYVDQKNVDVIVHDLGLSRRQYFYDLKEAVDAVTHFLVTEHRRRA